jgi:hypothetical protein
MKIQNESRKRPGGSRPVSIQFLRWILLLLVMGGSISACTQTDRLTIDDLVGTEVAQTLTSQAIQQEQARLILTETAAIQATQAMVATQTAQEERTSEPVIPPSPSPTSSPATPTLTFTVVTPTLTPTPVTPTPTSTATPKPYTPTVQVWVKDIYFKQGSTSAYIQKTIHSGEQQVYKVSAQAGQTLILAATSPGNDVYLDIKGMYDGQKLLSSSALLSYWSGTLPKGQPYQIALTTSNPSTSYFLSIEIPANIYFATGAYSTAIDGYIEVDTNFHPDILTRVRYLAWAAAGQTMTVKLTSPNLGALSVGIYGQVDGQAYVRYEVKNSGGKFVLSASQGYYIDVYAVKGKSTTFTLEVIIK